VHLRLCRHLLCFGSAVSLPAAADPPQWSGFVRAGVADSDAEASWINGGLGRQVADANHQHADLEAQSALSWEPAPDWNFVVQALVRGESAGRGRHAGLVEAYIDRHLSLADDSQIRLRAGHFFLPTSREAIDPLWQSRYTLTLSALNSWIAEEIRPIGIDASWRSSDDAAREWEWAVTAFNGNDSAGALLAWRGFSRHGRLSVLGEVLALPALPSLADDGAFGQQRDDGSKPFGPDLDGRVGMALRVRYGDPQRFRLFATGFDNRGDRALHRGEYAWRTRFVTIGGEWSPDPRWHVAGEWMTGRSGMGDRSGPHVDIDFSTAYLLASFARDEHWRFSVRLDHFAIDDRDHVPEDNDDCGHAATFAIFRALGDDWRVGLEFVTGDSAHAAAASVGARTDTDGHLLSVELRRNF